MLFHSETIPTLIVNRKLTEIAKTLKNKPEISKPFMVTSWSGIRPDTTIDELKTKSEDDLIQIMIDSSNGKRATPYDIAQVFSQLIDQKPDLLPKLLTKMKNKNISPDFAGEMVEAYRKKKSKEVAAIADLLKLLGKNDNYARIEIARYLNEICRKKGIQNITQHVKNKIRSSLIILSHDKNPETDGGIRSSNPSPENAITRGINSVRGIAMQALIAFCYHFPNDQIVSQRLKELAYDNTIAIKATLIYSLQDLIYKNYPLCEEIVNNFKNRRDSEIDYALIRFFSHLDCNKFLEYQDYIKLLFNNTNEHISEDLGELIGYHYVDGCDVQAIIDEIIGNRRGTKHTVQSLAFVFESHLGKLIGHPNDVRIAYYLKKLLNPQNNFDIVVRASFLFQREEIKPSHFEFLDSNELTTELILNKFNIPAQSHLVNYLQKCLELNISVDRCVELLHKQVMTIDGILSDQIIVNKIAEIVTKLITTDLSTKTKEFLQDIYNAGLERGWDDFYSIYFDLKSKRNNIL